MRCFRYNPSSLQCPTEASFYDRSLCGIRAYVNNCSHSFLWFVANHAVLISTAVQPKRHWKLDLCIITAVVYLPFQPSLCTTKLVYDTNFLCPIIVLVVLPAKFPNCWKHNDAGRLSMFLWYFLYYHHRLFCGIVCTHSASITIERCPIRES